MKNHTLAFLFLLSLASWRSEAAWLENVPQTLRQPDGSLLNCFASGDEYNNWLHDAAGYTIIQNPSTGYYVYAVLDNGNLEPTSYIAGRVDPAGKGLTLGLNVSPERMLQKRIAILSKSADPSMPEISAAPKRGSINNLCVFIRFSDENEFTDLQSKYTTMFNAETAGANSLRLFFFDASYNQLGIMTTVYPTGIPGATVVSYQDAHPRAYYQPYNATTNPLGYSSSGSDERDREHTLLKAAVDFIAPLVSNPANFDADNDGKIDNVCFIVSGSPTGWSSLLWPHRWSLYSQTAYIGTKRVYDYNLQLQQSVNTSVLCHEMSHTVGFPDLYHYTSDGKNPVGSWDLMAANRNPPQHMGAYMKMKYGTWIASIPSITASGTYTLQPLASSSNNAYKIASPNSSTEFFVLEYRKRQGTFESSVPGEGLLVYRINGAKAGQGNSGGPPDEIYIYRPGGTLVSEGTLGAASFSSTVGRTMINDTTSPAAFLSDGSLGGLNISEVGAPGSTLSFKITMSGSSTVTILTNPPGLALSVDGTSKVTPYASIWPDWTSHMITAASLQAGGTGVQYGFASWNDGGSQSHQVLASGGKATYEARYQTQYLLTMASDGGGAVVPSSGWHNSGESVAISATPGNGSYFNGWAGSGAGAYTGATNQVAVIMNGPISQTANFKQLGAAAEWVSEVPEVTTLNQNYPNPFNPKTGVRYQVSGVSDVKITVYDVLGREVAVLVNERKVAGLYEVNFDGSGLASGVYIYRLTAGSFTQSRKMVLTK
jgi:M6 family metalloprotease-like protein